VVRSMRTSGRTLILGGLPLSIQSRTVAGLISRIPATWATIVNACPCVFGSAATRQRSRPCPRITADRVTDRRDRIRATFQARLSDAASAAAGGRRLILHPAKR
jgi:hypothetical protein